MKKNLPNTFKLCLTSLFIITILGGCGQDTKDVKMKESDEAQEEVQKKKSDKKEEAKSKLGSRTNPVPFKKTVTVEDELYNDKGESFPIKFDLTVLEVTRGEDTYQKLKSMNEFNEPAPDGYEWLLAKTKVKFTESATKDLSLYIDGIMNFEMVSENGDIYSGDILGTTDPEFSYEMYVGNEKEGYISGLVKKGEKAQLRYEEMLGGNVFLNLQ
ncbi:hypothetical protein [Niallia circulans]|uniref:hypothetical protein n=1 Tax=Niallia circulans TaxID=1397 RepID=UPI0026EAB239|nr:hypothetical protein [Niallia circulans]